MAGDNEPEGAARAPPGSQASSGSGVAAGEAAGLLGLEDPAGSGIDLDRDLALRAPGRGVEVDLPNPAAVGQAGVIEATVVASPVAIGLGHLHRLVLAEPRHRPGVLRLLRAGSALLHAHRL